MKLLFFSSMYGAPWGGSEELWAGAALAALEDGHEVCVSTFDWQPRADAVERMCRQGARLLARPLRPSRFKSRLLQPPWVRELSAFDPQAVSLSQGSAYECVGRRVTRPLLRWLEKQQAPVVNTIQFNEPKHDLRPATRARSLRLMGLSACNAFVAARNIAEAEQTLDAPVPRARVVRNPVNMADKSAAAWPTSDGIWRMACVARLETEKKGQDLLMEVLSRRQWQGRPWTLSLFGEGDDRARLEHQAREHGLDSRVVFHGHTTNIRAVWAEHHLLVLPSRAEGTPLALVEAMLAGRPSVVTDVGGCLEWVQDGVSGFAAGKVSASAIAEAMERAWGAREKWQEMGEAARTQATELFDPDASRTLLDLLVGAVHP